MEHLIEDLLLYSRVGMRDLFVKPVDCEVVLTRALDNLQKALQESGALVTHDPLPTVKGDDTQLVQVFPAPGQPPVTSATPIASPGPATVLPTAMGGQVSTTATWTIRPGTVLSVRGPGPSGAERQAPPGRAAFGAGDAVGAEGGPFAPARAPCGPPAIRRRGQRLACRSDPERRQRPRPAAAAPSDPTARRCIRARTPVRRR